ncbi:ferritin-like domain-containing protein [Xylariaceae sp. AK1471]|nr:ferritin-like domain-containing protein [Xylariaceae sp. AK1471]
MRQSTFLALLAASSSIAAPIVEKRADFDAPAGGDITILNYALTLEYLERKFYQEGLANYTSQDFCDTGLPTEVYDNLKTIYDDEQSHVALLSAALGTAAVHEASYSFPSTDAASFLALASVLEGVGVSAYLGAAAAIANKAYVPVAGSILTVEARHSAYIRHALNESFAPKPYDTPLDFMQVYSLAAEFITGFAPGDPALPFTAFPPLAIVPDATPQVAGKTSLVFTGAAEAASSAGLVADGEKVYAVFYSGLDACYAEVTTCDADYELVTIPGANCSSADQPPPTGQVYVVLSTANGTIAANDENTISGVGILEVVAH